MRQKLTPRAMQQRAQMARRVLKRTRTLTRPTEAHAMMRANVAHLLARYRQTHNIADLEAYVAWVGEGNLFEDDFVDEVAIPDGERPTLRKGCARCGRRLPDEEFIEWALEHGREVPVRHFWCSDCRREYGSLRWQDVLNEDAWVTRDDHTTENHDMRRGARRKHTARQEE
jgi:hypothetical protein